MSEYNVKALPKDALVRALKNAGSRTLTEETLEADIAAAAEEISATPEATTTSPVSASEVKQSSSATLDNPADASVPNQQFYRLGLPNSPVKVVGHLVVVDAETGLVTSTDDDYYDRGLQNRDDDSTESDAKVNAIAANPDPLQLGLVESQANNGVAWMLPNRNVFIGNHRMNGVREAYARGTADKVEAFVRQDAAKRGIEIPSSVKKPIMVFVLDRIESPDGKTDIYEVVRLANESRNRGFGTPPPTRADILQTQREQSVNGPRFSVIGEGVPDYQAQYDAVVVKYKGTAQWMKAPNGKPTNLNERQWVQVRTPAFKAWFGDWEKAANANNVADWLLNTAPIAGISGEEFKKPASGENTLVDRVESFYKENFGGSVRSTDLGEVILNRDGIKASVAHGIGRNKAAAFVLVPDVIKHGRILNTYQNWKGRGYDSAVIVAPVSIHGEDFICEVIVTTEFGKQGFYLHEVNLKKDVASTIKTATGAVSTRDVAQPTKSSIAKILREVNEATSKVVD